jgi:hypothetical protein
MRRLYVRTYRKLVQYTHEFKKLGFHIPLIGLVIVVISFYNRVRPEIQHVLLALSAVYLVHLSAEFLTTRRLLILLDEGSLLKACDIHGITAIYESRAEVWKQLAEGPWSLLAERPSKVWAIGISLSADFHLERFLVELIKRKPKETRILLLDALTSTAVFRDCLESSRKDVLDGIAKKDKHRYFAHNVYEQFRKSLNLFVGQTRFKQFENSVRFYRHTPVCWMVRVDDVLFFQPYTFGSSRQYDEARTIGCDMPIFRIDRKQSDKAFHILADHFNKLWSTSDGSVHSTDDRDNCKDEIVSSIFAQRGDWLRSVCDALYETKLVDGMRQDRRTEARGLGTDMCGRFAFHCNGVAVDGGVADYTHASIALWVAGNTPCPMNNAVIRAQYLPGPLRSGVANEVANHYIQRFHDKDMVVRKVYQPKNDGSTHASDRRIVLGFA